MQEFNFLDKNPLLLIISGPSGVGKDAVLAELKVRQTNLHFIVTATTRLPRTGEINGKDYWFYTIEEFANLLQKGEFLENAVVYGNSYGVPKEDVRQALKRGEDVIMRIDVQGAAHIKRIAPEAIFVFLAPPSFEALFARLGNRNTETKEDLERRLNTYQQEMLAVSSFNYFVINYDEQLHETVNDILAIIKAEKLRTFPSRVAF